jgi:lipopolysaccharide biosynthesis glycosyltransferase
MESEKKFNIYVGYDWNQDVAFNVCKESILKYSSIATNVHRINCNTVNGYKREADPLASTPFTYARFYVPFLNNFKGVSLFCDGDFLFLEDIKGLFEKFNPTYAVQVVKHDYTPTNAIKMNDKIQTIYPRKNWSSLILWNNEHPKNKQLNLELLNKSTGSFLHQFKWLEDNEIGSISHEWNWLVGWYQENETQKPKALHFTEGGPWLKPAENKYDQLWLDFKELTNF